MFKWALLLLDRKEFINLKLECVIFHRMTELQANTLI